MYYLYKSTPENKVNKIQIITCHLIFIIIAFHIPAANTYALYEFYFIWELNKITTTTTILFAESIWRNNMQMCDVVYCGTTEFEMLF